MNMLDGICGKVAPGLCRLALDGRIAVRTGSGYRSFDPEKKRLTNCDSFVMDVGEDFFFVLPTNRVQAGDIILAGGKPKCVLSSGRDTITAISFEDATVETLIPEHHPLIGSTWMYGKIVSLFGRNGIRGRKGAGRMMKYMMLSGMMKNKEGGSSALLPFLLMGGKADLLDDLFDPDPEDEEEDDINGPEA